MNQVFVAIALILIACRKWKFVQVNINIIFHVLAITVSDCTADPDNACKDNTDGKTVCVTNMCSGKLYQCYAKEPKKKIQ